MTRLFLHTSTVMRGYVIALHENSKIILTCNASRRAYFVVVFQSLGRKSMIR